MNVQPTHAINFLFNRFFFNVLYKAKQTNKTKRETCSWEAKHFSGFDCHVCSWHESFMAHGQKQ